MTIEEVFALNDFDKIKAELTKNGLEGVEENVNLYEGLHKILEKPDKVVKGQTVSTAKLVTKFQKKIVQTAVAFAVGKGHITLAADTPESEKGVEVIKAWWKTMKLDRHTKNLLTRLKIEKRVAELFYVIKRVDGFALRVRLMCRKNGDTIFPYWDDYGDLIAITRLYKVTIEGKEFDAVDIWTADHEIHSFNKDGWQNSAPVKNPLGKIPVIYYEQPETEWEDVQGLIDRIEKLLSAHADTNDYVGNPAVKVKGQLKNMPEKDENVKVFQVLPENIDGKASYGDVEYMVYTGAPESVRMEYQNLKELVYSLTSTPDLSFNNVKGTGNLSGLAFKFMFMDAMLKAEDARELLSEGLERRVNVLKAMLEKWSIETASTLDELEVSISYEDIMPKNIEEVFNNLTKAVEGKAIMSRKTAVTLNPLVTNPQDEYKQMMKEEAEAMPAQESFIPGQTDIAQ
jgi:SPP1 family phage portal protein